MRPYSGLLNKIPPVSKVAVTLGVIIGIFVCAALGGPDETAGRIGLGVAIAVGLIAAIALPPIVDRRSSPR
jgi:hypothetical protein